MEKRYPNNGHPQVEITNHNPYYGTKTATSIQDTTKSFITTAGQNQSTSDDTISQNVSNEIPSYRGKSRMCVRNLKMSFAICIWNLGTRVTQ